MEKILDWIIPIHTISEANCSEHWSKKKKRHDIQKRWIKVYFKNEGQFIPLPCHVKLTRLGKRLLDSDNLPVSMKWLRDEIANQLIPGLAAGRADDDKRITWEYAQEKSKEYKVIVTFFY
jgi:hypothetical protein